MQTKCQTDTDIVKNYKNCHLIKMLLFWGVTQWSHTIYTSFYVDRKLLNPIRFSWICWDTIVFTISFPLIEGAGDVKCVFFTVISTNGILSASLNIREVFEKGVACTIVSDVVFWCPYLCVDCLRNISRTPQTT